jgi:cytoskeletal protein CcmA (bactofilin family)
MSPLVRHRRARRGRRASAYLLVLGSTVLLTGMIFGALELERAQSSSASLSIDASDARLAAQSGLEIAIDMVAAAGSSWRSNATLRSGSWASGMLIGRAKVNIGAYDPIDGNIATGDQDTVVVRSIATVGNAVQAVTCTLTPTYTPSVLVTDYSIATGDQVSVSGTVAAALPMISWNRVSASGATITPKVIANSTTGSTFAGGTGNNTLASSTLPGNGFIDTYYTPTATSIAYSALSSGRLEKCVLGPRTNPFGAGNAAGVYQIDCNGSDITIRNCRIVGTLILINPGSNSRIDNNVSFEQASDGMPCLLTKGRGLTISIASSTLSESVVGVNFNPGSVPYQSVGDTDTSDTYPTGFNGLIYLDGDSSISGTVSCSGSIVVNGKLDLSGTLTINPDLNARTTPPPGFRTGPTMTVSGSSIVQYIP